MAEQKKNVFDQYYYRINKICMCVLGIWPEQSLLYRRLIPFLVATLLLSALIPALHHILLVWGVLDRVMESMYETMVLFAAIMLLFNGCNNIEKMGQILNRISRDWDHFKDLRSLEVLHKYAAHGRFITVVYSIVIYGGMIIFLNGPLVPAFLDTLLSMNETRPIKIPYQFDYGVDPNDYFVEIFIHTYICTVVTIFIIVTFASMYFVNIQHACALFKVFGTNFKMSLVSKEANEDRNFKMISYCINLHQSAISFVDLLESTYTMVSLGALLAFIGTITACGAVIVIRFDQIEDVLKYGICILTVTFVLYFTTFPGQDLIDHSLEIHSITFELQWYEMSTRVQRLLLLIMLRSIRPCVLTAGKLYVMSVENFRLVIQTTVSYFTVFLSVH